MEYTELVKIIETFGFPIACVIAMGVFIFIIYRDTNKTNKENITQLQESSKEREEKLYDEIGRNREVISQAISTIAKYAEKLEIIQNDIKEIKSDVIRIDPHVRREYAPDRDRELSPPSDPR